MKNFVIQMKTPVENHSKRMNQVENTTLQLEYKLDEFVH
jgi:hypothetical protein